jgi:hypothetical protein
MLDTFQRFPFLEIIADPLDPQYKIKYTECVQERGSIRFERREFRVPMSEMVSIIEDIMRSVGVHGR